VSLRRIFLTQNQIVNQVNIFFSTGNSWSATTCESVKEVRYLGHIINDKLQDEADMSRELCKAYNNTAIWLHRLPAAYYV